MATFKESLVPTSNLKMDYLARVMKERLPIHLRYDSELDAFLILFDSPNQERVVHYVDEYMGLLYNADTMEIIGLQIEDFEYSFLPKHANVREVWNFKNQFVNSFGDLIITYENAKPKIAKEIWKVSEERIGKEHPPVATFFKKAPIAEQLVLE